METEELAKRIAASARMHLIHIAQKARTSYTKSNTNTEADLWVAQTDIPESTCLLRNAGKGGEDVLCVLRSAREHRTGGNQDWKTVEAFEVSRRRLAREEYTATGLHNDLLHCDLYSVTVILVALFGLRATPDAVKIGGRKPNYSLREVPLPTVCGYRIRGASRKVNPNKETLGVIVPPELVVPQSPNPRVASDVPQLKTEVARYPPGHKSGVNNAGLSPRRPIGRYRQVAPSSCCVVYRKPNGATCHTSATDANPGLLGTMWTVKHADMSSHTPRPSELG
ncbi:hypothetical protein B0H16DRAFT_1711595 [Mycena metata]|uniref:Uncharacterized protein n=1 Tax=Mycena metata TaxID=1033252 RepID=A0AAD7NXI9_9AGAR|nr:hypothetical protein B0H16DRAFT_1711595 [Mycena metata]